MIVMESWVIKKAEKMTSEEQKTYSERMIEKYKKEIARLKDYVKSQNKDIAIACFWRCNLLVCAAGLITGGVLAAVGNGNVELAGQMTMEGSILLSLASLVTAVLQGDEGLKGIEGIKKANLAKQEAKKEIKVIKEKIKELEKTQGKGNR